MAVSVLCECKCTLGESPLWIPERNSIVWVDIEAQSLYEHRLDTGHTNSTQFDRRIGLVVQSQKPNVLIMGMQGGIAQFDLSSNKLQWLTDLEKDKPLHRCNDGSCDPTGRLWVGTMSIELQEGVGSLYMVDESLSIHKKLGGLTIPNGLIWAPDNAKMYHIDTAANCVTAFAYDKQSGDISFERVAIRIPPSMGYPDGMAMDMEGMLWIAHYGGFGVYRWNPNTGALLDKIDVPVPNVTACTFGGNQLDTLYITTARQELDEEQLKDYPESGHVFYVKLGISGLPKYKYQSN